MTDSGLDKLLAKEALGDANNFKGTDYHLWYAAWLLLTRRAQIVAFYAGNDLLFTPAAPTQWDSADELSAQLSVTISDQVDEWVQLKVSTQPWTAGAILEENLIANFVCNGVRSELAGRQWRIRLTTNQELRSNDLRAFAKKPEDFPKLDKTFTGILAHLATVLPDLTASQVRQRTLDVIERLAECTPTHKDTLVAEVREVLSREFAGDAELANAAANNIRSAMLADVSASPPVVRSYDLKWLSDVTGHDFTERYPLNSSLTSTCDRQVAEHCEQQPRLFSPEICVAREGLDAALGDFLNAKAPLFVLDGPSGMGKSWTLMDWTSNSLAGKPRVIVSRPNPLALTAESLIHTALARFAPPKMTDREVFAKFRAAGNSDHGPAVVVIDDLRPDLIEHLRCAQQLERLVLELQREGIKLVVSCQSDLVRNLHPFSHVPAKLVFNPEGDKPGTPHLETADPRPSYSLAAFSEKELHSAVQKRLPETAPEVMGLLLRDPTYAELRHPYTLDAVLSAGHVGTAAILRALADRGLGRLIDDRIEAALSAASRHVGVSQSDVRTVFEKVVALLCDGVQNSATRRQILDQATELNGNDGETNVRGLLHVGLLSFDPVIEIPDVRVQARLFAKRLLSSGLSVAELNSRLTAADSELVTALVTGSSQPAQLAEALVELGSHWIGPVAEGLVICDLPNDPSVGACLLALARQERSSWHATDAYGRLALRSEAVRADLFRRFLSESHGDQSLAERALWSIARYAPTVVLRAVALRFRLASRPLATHRTLAKKDEWRKWRRSLARAIRVLENVDSESAATQVLTFLPRYESLATDSFLDDKQAFAAADSLLHEFDQCRTIAASFADPDAFAKFLAQLSDEDLLIRTRAVHALEAASYLSRDDVARVVVERLSQEADPLLLARVLWQAYRAAQKSPERVIEALALAGNRLWSDYGTGAASLSLLEVLLPTDPEKVVSILPLTFSSLDVETRALLAELVAFVRIRGKAYDEAQFLESLNVSDGDTRTSEQLALLEFHQLRAKASALLLNAIAASGIAEWPQVWRLELRDRGVDFLKLQFGTWIQDVDVALLPPEYLPAIMDALLAAVLNASAHPCDMRDRWHAEVRFNLQCDCFDTLLKIATHTGRLNELITSLPDDWEKLYAVNYSLANGLRDEWLTRLGLGELESKKNSRTAQASHEMTKFEVLLNRIAPHLIPPRDRRDSDWFFSSANDHSEKISAAFDSARPDPFADLERLFEKRFSLVDSTFWNAEAQRTYGILTSDAYSRMSPLRELSPSDAARITSALVLGAATFRGQLAADEHRELYSAILNRLQGKTVELPLIRDSSNPVVQSHRLAVEILRLENPTLPQLRTLLADRRGWQESKSHRWNEFGEIERGWGVSYHLTLFFPAVRLALIAAGQEARWNDPGFTWMKERQEAKLAVQNSGFDRANRPRDQSIPFFRELYAKLPQQECIPAHLGYLLLTDGKFAEALDMLIEALSSPLCVDAHRREVLYNVACAQARLGNADECRTALTDSISKQTTRKQLDDDEDFASVRHLPWFQEIVASLTS